MIKYLQNSKYLLGNISVGIHIEIRGEDDYKFTFVVLKKQKKDIRIEKTGTLEDNFENLLSLLPENAPIFLSIDGKGMASKKIECQEGQDSGQWLAKVFPTASLSEFYVQKYEINNDESFVTVSRKQSVDAILDAFIRLKKHVFNIQLGPFIVKQVLGVLDAEGTTIGIENYEMTLVGNNIIDFKKSQTAPENVFYRIGSENVRYEYLLPFASALSFFMGTQNEPMNELLAIQKEDFIFKQCIKKIGIVFVGLFFGALLLNFLLFSKLTSKHSELSGILAKNEKIAKQLDEMKMEIGSQERFIREQNIFSISRFSFFADRIAYSVPASVKLDGLNINPVQKQIKEGQLPEFLRNVIVISGESMNTESVNSWIKILKDNTWVEEIKIISFNQSSKTRNVEFKMELLLNIEEVK